MSTGSRLTFAFLVTPHLGGTYSVFTNLRRGLAAHDIDLRWVGAGPRAAAAMADPQWQEEAAVGAVVAGDAPEQDQRAQGLALVEHLCSAGYDGVFINVLTSVAEMAVARHLPERVRRVTVVHNITPGTYAAARALRDHVHATIAVSPRAHDDLVGRRGFDPARTHMIPNALDPARCTAAAAGRRPAGGSTLRALSLGRISDPDKGILWLPRILDRLADVDVMLTIAGDGPDLPELRRRCATHERAGRARFLGRVPYAEVPAVLAAHDVFLMPSRFEGLPVAALEAMATGCVPAASRIRGVTDFLIEDGATGLLFPVGDVAAAAGAVRRLATDRALLEACSAAGRRAVQERFDVGAMADAYAKVIRGVMSGPPAARPPLPAGAWDPGWRLGPGLVRRFLPLWVKNLLRNRRA